jgi:hypothetical protein
VRESREMREMRGEREKTEGGGGGWDFSQGRARVSSLGFGGFGPLVGRLGRFSFF